MFYLINPLSWPFTIIPNLPPNLFEVIDSPIPLLIGVLGNKETAFEINEIRNGNCNIIIINNSGLQYYKEEKINFSKEPMNNLYFSLLKNYSELKMNLNKKKDDENYNLSTKKYIKIFMEVFKIFLQKKLKRRLKNIKIF